MIHAPDVADEPVVTNDLAEIAPDGYHFRILGRRDNVICSGGIKIQTEEVERLLLPHLSAPFMITHRNDARFGEIVVMLTEAEDLQTAEEICCKVLPKYWQPRLYRHIDSLPMTATGKPDRAKAARMAAL